MKKILLITQYFAPRHGGAENYYTELSKHLPAEAVVVLADKALLVHGQKPETHFDVLYKQFLFSSKFIWPKWLRLLFVLPGVIYTYKPDVLWAGEVLPTGLAVKIIASIFRLPYMVSTHGADILNPQRQHGFKRRWKTGLLKYVLLSSSLTTANTEYTKLLLSKLGVPREKSLVIYPAATNVPLPEHEVSNAAIDIVRDLKKEGYTIVLGVNRLEKRKGIDMVIKSLPFVWKERPKVAYIVVSNGPYADELKKLAQKVDTFIDNRRRIFFTGFQSSEETAALYNLCDVFVMVPRIIDGLAEGFGIVYIEAGTFGKPVIGTKMTGIPEAICELYDQNYDNATGLLISDPTDVKEIAKKILMLVKDKGLAKKLGDNNKKRAEKFNYQDGADTLMNAVQEITS